MAIRLEKGQRINLEKDNGTKLTQFCVGCNWGAVVKSSGFFGLGKTEVDVDLDLSCLLLDAQGKIIDHVYSPQYRPDFLARYGFPPGKLDSQDRALHHTGDDTKGDAGGEDDGLDNEIITVDLNKVNPQVDQIVFFLNICKTQDFSGDFSVIPYAYIRMFEPFMKGDKVIGVKETFAQYDVSTKTDCKGMSSLILGRLYRKNGEWKFAAVGDAYPDNNIGEAMQRIANIYLKR